MLLLYQHKPKAWRLALGLSQAYFIMFLPAPSSLMNN